MARLRFYVFWAACSGWSIACGGEKSSSSDWDSERAVDADDADRTSTAASNGTNSLRTSTATSSRTAPSTTGQQASTAPNDVSGTRSTDTGLQGSNVGMSCGDGKMDAGETCDDGPSNSDTRANACRTSCVKASCGDGVRDEGENCDTGTQNSDTESDSCRTDCTLPRCGDGVVDVGRSEACDGDDNCGSRCTVAECGDNVVEGQEDCEPGLDADCAANCTRVAAPATADDGTDDSTSETSQDSETQAPDTSDQTEQPTADTADESATADDSGPSTDNSETLFDFESSAQGWELYETSPETLEAETRVEHDPDNGENSNGALELFGPFEDSDQKLEAQVSFESPRNLSGRVLRARARLSSGLSLDRQNPGGIKLFVKTGDSYSYAAGAFVALTEGFGWVEFVVDMDEPELVFEAADYDPTQVRQVGIELRTFEQTTEALPATVYVDSISF